MIVEFTFLYSATAAKQGLVHNKKSASYGRQQASNLRASRNQQRTPLSQQRASTERPGMKREPRN